MNYIAQIMYVKKQAVFAKNTTAKHMKKAISHTLDNFITKSATIDKLMSGKVLYKIYVFFSSGKTEFIMRNDLITVVFVACLGISTHSLLLLFSRFWKNSKMTFQCELNIFFGPFNL